LVSLLQVRNNGTQWDIFRSVDSAADGYSTRSEIRLVSERISPATWRAAPAPHEVPRSL
jgi:hypothetical protein